MQKERVNMYTRVLYPITVVLAMVLGLDLTPVGATQDDCPAPEDRLSALLNIAKRLEGIPYDKAPEALRDSSGIFLQFAQRFQKRCSNLPIPKPETHRSTRSIARWYAENGTFTRITDPLTQADLIKPGMVMFYGIAPRRDPADKKEALITEQELLEQAIKRIRHIGIVVGIEPEDGAPGEITRYHLFNGRRPGRPSKITKYHYRESKSYPNAPFGNGKQQWIGMAPFYVEVNVAPKEATQH